MDNSKQHKSGMPNLLMIADLRKFLRLFFCFRISGRRRESEVNLLNRASPVNEVAVVFSEIFFQQRREHFINEVTHI